MPSDNRTIQAFAEGAVPFDFAGIEKMFPGSSNWMRSMEDMVMQRSKGVESVRFVTFADLHQSTLNSLASAFADGPSGVKGSDVPTVAQINYTIEQLQDLIRKSLIYQALENVIGDLDLSSFTADIEARVGQSYAAIGTEKSVRANKDNALASAINNVWSQIGGTAAVIQDGQLASVSPSSASATKWTQVVASVTDPNTGLVNSTSIKQDLNSYANSANGTFNSIYSVRAQIDTAGRTVVGGFGLSATSGAGSSQGPVIDFGVRADKFFIAATSSTPDGTTQENQGNSIPFMVLTTPQNVNGVFYPAGVYIKQATIGDATIGTAKIADAAITNAKIGYAIQSSNWNGSTGWYIDKSGTAYFLNIVARGNIEASSVQANVISADQIISESLAKFYTTTSGFSVISHAYTAAAIRISANPGGGEVGGKDPYGYANTVHVFIDNVYYGKIVSGGVITIYNMPPGSRTVFVALNVQSTNPGFAYLGRVDIEVVIR